MNRDMLVFLKGLAIVGILLLLSTPLILMNVFQGDLSGPWIGFWGSFAGGILGTAGVIYVAYIQNENQKTTIKKENENQLQRLHKSEEFQRRRLFIENEINLIKDYNEKLNKLKYETYTLTRSTMNLYRALDYHYNVPKKEKHYFVSAIRKHKKDKDYTYLHNLASTIMRDKSVIDSLQNSSGTHKSDTFKSTIDNEDIEGVVLRINDMYEMLSLENINLEVFRKNYGRFVIYNSVDYGLIAIPIERELTKWLSHEIEHSTNLLVSELNSLRELIDSF